MALVLLLFADSAPLFDMAVVIASVIGLRDLSRLVMRPSESGNVSALGSIANLIIPPIAPYTLLLMAGKRNVLKKIALGAALVFLLMALFMLGRRYLIYVFVLFAIALRMQGYRFTKKGVAIAGVLALIGFVVLYIGFNFFMALRFAIDELDKDASLTELIHLTMANISGPDAGAVRDSLTENIGYRPLILSYLGGLMGIDSNQIPTYGMELLYSLQMAIPSLLMPGKTDLLPPSSEELVHPLYGIPVFDGPGSFLVTGFDDFGLAGAIIYPLAVIWLFSFFYKILRSTVRDQTIRFFVLFALMFQLLYIEQGFSAVFVTLRNLIIVIGIMWCLGKFPVVKLLTARQKTAPGTVRHVDSANAD